MFPKGLMLCDSAFPEGATPGRPSSISAVELYNQYAMTRWNSSLPATTYKHQLVPYGSDGTGKCHLLHTSGTGNLPAPAAAITLHSDQSAGMQSCHAYG